MRDSVDNLYKLLENLLTWSRTQLGTIQCNPQYIDISTLIKQVKNSVNLICVSKNISIKTTINGNDKIYADYNMIQTILRNLLTNAIKFSYADSYIELTFDSDQTDTIITVSDNGVGMNAETIECLFKIDKVNPTIGTRKEQGTGLGLILCNEFVKKHNGTITISAEEGLGTKIIVKLPLKK
jgi:signal transduction histidine kinase